MIAKALETIREYQMFSQGSKLAVALSGGADSVALLHFLWGLRAEMDLTVAAVHLNHNLRGEESLRDEEFVRALCRDLGVELTVESADVAGQAAAAGESLEVCGRRLRYRLFRRVARETGAKIALAHTLSDSAETVLLNLIRGTGLRGLGGIPPTREEIIRPLIGCTRLEIEEYCRQHGLSFVDDSTNATDAYTRNRIRRHVIPLLERENPRFLEHTARMTVLLRADAAYLDELAREAAEGLADGDSCRRSEFLALPSALRGRVLGGLLKSHGLEMSGDLIGRMEETIEAGRGKRQLSGDLYLVCGKASFEIRKLSEPRDYFEAFVPAEEIILGTCVEIYPGKSLKMSVDSPKMAEKPQYFQKRVLNYCLDYDRIRGILTVRQKKAGDKLRPPGRGCAKTLKNLFQEAGVPPPERAQRIVLADEDGVLWVEGIGPDQRGAVAHETARIVTLEITEVPHVAG